MHNFKVMYFVYVLKSKKDGRHYIGYSTDVYRRLAEHNEGKTIATMNRRPLELIYYEAHLNKESALRREHYFKTTKGKTTLKMIFR